MALVGPVVYQIYVNGVRFTHMSNVIDAELRESFGNHDMLFLRVEYNRFFTNIKNITTWADGSLIQMVWGRTPDVNSWYGYVNHSEIKSQADSGTKTQQITYVCIGTSSVLNIDRTRTWNQVSPTYIAQRIALENRLRCVVSNTPWVLDYEVQAGESDFSFMNRIADLTGMRFWCSCGTLYLLGPAVSVTGSATGVIPQFNYNKDLSVQDTLRDFRLLQGGNLPGTFVANRTIYGLDITSGALFGATSAPSTATTATYINTDRPATTMGEGQMIVNSWQALSQFWIGARAQIFGNTLIYPGKLVNLQGVALMDKMTGIWLVTKVRHMLFSSGLSATQDRFVTDIEMMRNQKGNDVLLDGLTQVSPEFSTMSVAGTNWVSNTGRVITTS